MATKRTSKYRAKEGEGSHKPTALLPKNDNQAAYIKQDLQNKLIDHANYIRKNGDDMPAIRDWKWPGWKPKDRETPS